MWNTVRERQAWLIMLTSVIMVGACPSSHAEGNMSGGANSMKLVVHYQFDQNMFDAAGSANGNAIGSPVYAVGRIGQSIELDGLDDYIQLPASVANSDDITIAAWINWDGGKGRERTWQRVFDFGNNKTLYLFLTPSSASRTLRFAITSDSYEEEERLEAPELTVGEWTHIAVTLEGDTGTLYVNGAIADSKPITLDPSTIYPVHNYIGKSQWGDPLFNGRIDDFRVYNYALSASEVAALSQSGGLKSIVACYAFEGNLLDSINSKNGINSGDISFIMGHAGQAIFLDGSNDYVMLPAVLIDSHDITVAAWVNWDGGGPWQRIFDFGAGTDAYFLLTPRSGGDTLRFVIRKGNVENILETDPLLAGQWTHVAVSIKDDVGKMYTNGNLAITGSIELDPFDIKPYLNYLGKSQWPYDPLFNGRIDDFYIFSYALTQSEIEMLAGRKVNPSYTSATPIGLQQPQLQNPSLVSWMPDFKEAQTKAQAQNKPRILYFYQNDIGICKKVDEGIIASASFQTLAENFVCYREEITPGKGVSYCCDNNKFTVYRVPTLMLQNKQGQIVRAFTFARFDQDRENLYQLMSNL
ncbi:thioredoxin family protein [Candidatus Sumerlaeota bacterium]|nr:thioredoxin family protein [Candidatus Sumerlaeota bacterium]